MAKYDIESILADVRTFLGNNLNSQLTALDSEKNDAITLKQVDSSAYHLQYLGDRVEAFDPFVLYGEAEEPLIQPSGPGVAITYRIMVWLILADNGTDSNIIKRLLRYRRALKEIFLNNWATIAGNIKMKVEESLPTPAFKDQETGFEGRAVGVIVSLTLAE